MVSINSIQNSSLTPSFKSEQARLISTEKHDDYEARIYEVPASTGKKWGVGLASFLCSGLGQAINGDWGKAAGFFFSSFLLGILGGATVHRSPVVGLTSGIGAMGIGIWSIVDAVRNAKSKQVQIIPKNATPQSFNYVG